MHIGRLALAAARRDMAAGASARALGPMAPLELEAAARWGVQSRGGTDSSPCSARCTGVLEDGALDPGVLYRLPGTLSATGFPYADEFPPPAEKPAICRHEVAFRRLGSNLTQEEIWLLARALETPKVAPVRIWPAAEDWCRVPRCVLYVLRVLLPGPSKLRALQGDYDGAPIADLAKSAPPLPMVSWLTWAGGVP